MRPYYESEGVTLFLGDCREVLPQVEHADLIFADPPYGVNKAEWDAEYPAWVVPLMLAHGRTVAITPGEWALQRCMTDLDTFYCGMLVGRNLNGMTHGNIGFANFIPVVVAGKKPRPTGPTAFEFSVNGDKPDHPSPKPLPFMRWVVNRLSDPGHLVVDPFAGSGTTMLAAKNLGRRAIGIEISEAYCELAARRLSQRVLDLQPGSEATA